LPGKVRVEIVIVELRNFHVIIRDHDLFEENVFNFHTIFFDGKATTLWEIFLAEWRTRDNDYKDI
jgi:hypothetical protein